MSSSIDDIYERIQRSQDEQQQQQRLNVASQVAPDYDRAARIFAVEANTQLPYDVVDADLENLEDLVRRDSYDPDKYRDQVNGAPAFNAFAAEHPYHISVLERDRKNLTRLERALNPLFLGWDSGWAMTEIAEIRDRQLTDFENPDNEKDKARLDELRKFTEGGMFGADTWYEKVFVGTAQQLPIQGWLIGESLDEIAIGAVAGTAIPGAGTLSGAGTGLMVGRTEAAFRLERGLAYDQYLGLGLDEEQARWASNAVGGVNAALESIGLGALTKRIPGFKQIQNDATGALINSVLTKPTFRQAAARAALQYGEGVATELVTEVLQESTLIVGQELLKRNARESGDIREETRAMTSDEFWNSVGEIAAHTLYGTALIGGVGPGASFYLDSKRAYVARRLGSAWEAMGEAAEASETRKNAPTKYSDFVERIGKTGKILVEARRFIDYFQEQGMDASEVAISVGVTAEQLSDAEMNGHDIEIPAGQYITKIAPSQHHGGLVKDLRTNYDAMTIREAEAFEANKPAVVKEVEKLAATVEDAETVEARETIIEDVKGQLVKAFTSPEAAENQAQLMGGIVNIAQRMKIDPMELYDEVYGGVVATTNAQMRAEKEDVDLYVDPYLDRIRSGDLPSQRDIFGPSVADRIKALGGLAPDAELDARDFKKSFRGLIKDTGDTLDGIAEILQEEGYIAARDPQAVLDALTREESGELVFGNQFKEDSEARELLGQLEQLAQILDQHGIDINDMSNAEVRAALEEADTLYQDDKPLDTTELEALSEMVFTVAEHDPAMLAHAEVLLPKLAEAQDFGDVTFTDTFTLDDGRPVTRQRAANREFEIASKRKNLLQKLKDCLGG